MLIRRLNKDDACQIIALEAREDAENSHVYIDMNSVEISKKLEDETLLIIGAFDKDQLIGFSAMAFQVNSNSQCVGDETITRVGKNYTNIGIGKKLRLTLTAAADCHLYAVAPNTRSDFQFQAIIGSTHMRSILAECGYKPMSDRSITFSREWKSLPKITLL